MIGTKNTIKILETIQTGLQVLVGQTEKLMKAVENLEAEEEEMGRSPKAKTTQGASKGTRSKKTAKTATQSRRKGRSPSRGKSATDEVVEMVERASKPLDVATLAKRTGFEQKKVRNIVSRAAKQGRVTRVGRGLYAAQSPK